MKRGFVSNEQRATRGLAKGKIASLAAGFSLKNGSPFSLTIIPKANVTGRLVSVPENSGLLVECMLYEDSTASDLFIPFNWPSEALIYQVSIGAIELATYDVYWTCGSDDEPLV